MPLNINRNHAIGVFDSGLGGLTVVKALMRQLPHEHIVYFGDTARVPYGIKSRESIIRFSKENIFFLLEQRVKIIVVACNTASSIALGVLTRMFPFPIIGVIEPGARKAVAATKNKKIGVIATKATVNSQSYPMTVKQFDPSIKVISQACPLFVPLVEEGWLKGKVTDHVAEHYLLPFKKARVDTLVLGCTHYPLLKTVIQKVMGGRVTLVDSAQEVASEVKTLLLTQELHNLSTAKARHHFWVSDEPRHFCQAAKSFLGYDVADVKRCRYV